MKHTRTLIASLMLAVPLASTLAQADAPSTVIAGQDLDNGLGSLPPYREWHRHAQLKRLVISDVHALTGEKIDSGLGDLPPYARWGHYPELRRFAAPTVAGI